MILALKVKLLSGRYTDEEWEGVIEIDSRSSLDVLHYAIQRAVDFDNDHLYEFYSARTERSGNRISYNDESCDLCKKTIGSLFPLPERHSLYYLFDYGDHWVFKITRKRGAELEPDSDLVYPRLASEIGKKPVQYGIAEE